jgi:hypothetical protein
MPSKRFKKLSENTNILPADNIEKLLSVIKKNCTVNLMNLLILAFK